MLRCAIWHHLYNLKNMKNTHGEVLLLVKLQAKACNITKSNTPRWVFFTFFKLCKWYQIAENVTNVWHNISSVVSYQRITIFFMIWNCMVYMKRIVYDWNNYLRFFRNSTNALRRQRFVIVAISSDVLKFRKIIEFQSSWIVMNCQLQISSYNIQLKM